MLVYKTTLPHRRPSSLFSLASAAGANGTLLEPQPPREGCEKGARVWAGRALALFSETSEGYRLKVKWDQKTRGRCGAGDGRRGERERERGREGERE
eukprot:scaffold94412_cov19-Tisochrysis_lutea.AAC.1